MTTDKAMTIDEAIKILTNYAEEAARHNLLDYAAAQKMGIEALKFAQDTEQEFNAWRNIYLPGGTKE